MKIDSKDVIKLRKETDIPILECRQALEEAQGNLKKAKEVLKKRSEAIAAKKASRESNQGIIETYIHGGGKIGVIVQITCETDFVARNKDFQDFAHEVAMQIAATNPEDVESLLKEPFIKDQDISINEYLNQLIAKIGENIQIKKFTRYEIGG